MERKGTRPPCERVFILGIEEAEIVFDGTRNVIFSAMAFPRPQPSRIWDDARIGKEERPDLR